MMPAAGSPTITRLPSRIGDRRLGAGPEPAEEAQPPGGAARWRAAPGGRRRESSARARRASAASGRRTPATAGERVGDRAERAPVGERDGGGRSQAGEALGAVGGEARVVARRRPAGRAGCPACVEAAAVLVDRGGGGGAHRGDVGALQARERGHRDPALLAGGGDARRAGPARSASVAVGQVRRQRARQPGPGGRVPPGPGCRERRRPGACRRSSSAWRAPSSAACCSARPRLQRRPPRRRPRRPARGRLGDVRGRGGRAAPCVSGGRRGMRTRARPAPKRLPAPPGTARARTSGGMVRRRARAMSACLAARRPGGARDPGTAAPRAEAWRARSAAVVAAVAVPAAWGGDAAALPGRAIRELRRPAAAAGRRRRRGRPERRRGGWSGSSLMRGPLLHGGCHSRASTASEFGRAAHPQRAPRQAHAAGCGRRLRDRQRRDRAERRCRSAAGSSDTNGVGGRGREEQRRLDRARGERRRTPAPGSAATGRCA